MPAPYHRLDALPAAQPTVSKHWKCDIMWILLKQETVNDSGISWAICKSATHSRQITTPAPHHSVFFTGRMPFLPPNQQHQSTEGTLYLHNNLKTKNHGMLLVVFSPWISCYFLLKETLQTDYIKTWWHVTRKTDPANIVQESNTA